MFAYTPNWYIQLYTVYYSYSIFSYIYWYIPNWYIFISVKKDLVYIPTRYRPSGRTFALGPPCGRLAGTLRLPCVCLENSMAAAGTP